jgi:hypothetical protein
MTMPNKRLLTLASVALGAVALIGCDDHYDHKTNPSGGAHNSSDKPVPGADAVSPSTKPVNTSPYGNVNGAGGRPGSSGTGATGDTHAPGTTSGTTGGTPGSNTSDTGTSGTGK